MIWGGVCMFVEPSAQSMPALPLVILTALLQQLLRIRRKNIYFSATWSLVFLGTMPKSAIELGWPGSPLFSSQCQKDLHHRCPGSYFSPPGMQGAARAGICPLFLQSCTMDAVPWTQYGSQGPGQKAAVCSGANSWKAPTWASVLAGWSTWGNTVGGVRNVTIEIFALVKCSDWKLLDLIPVNLSEPHSLYCSAQPSTRRQELGNQCTNPAEIHDGLRLSSSWHHCWKPFLPQPQMRHCLWAFNSNNVIQIYRGTNEITSSNIKSTKQSHVVLHHALDLPLFPPQENQEKLTCVCKCERIRKRNDIREFWYLETEKKVMLTALATPYILLSARMVPSYETKQLTAILNCWLMNSVLLISLKLLFVHHIILGCKKTTCFLLGSFFKWVGILFNKQGICGSPPQSLYPEFSIKVHNQVMIWQHYGSGK